MTRKLFYENTHMTTFETAVTECIKDEDRNLYRVLLEATAFFPEEGGQTPDKGTLNSQEVLDVQIQGDRIYHYVQAPIEAGTTVQGQVDWTQRFDFMQQHSGEHIISGLVHAHYGLRNVGFHLSVNEVTLDFDAPLSLEQLREIEREANAAIYANLPILISYPDEQELASLEYRSKIEIEGQVRIVTIPGIDVCACCAPHVESTGQIGMIKITNVQSHRGGIRVNILCGMRALEDYTAKQTGVSAVSATLSVPQEQISQGVQRLREESLRHKERANELQARYLELTLSTLPGPEASPDVVLFVGPMDTIAIRNAVNTLTATYPGYCGIFSGEADNYQFILGSSTKDCRELANVLRNELSAKCGGSAPMIQGSVSAIPQQLQLLICK
ncbi:MAG: alanyl-tRNA editing protein [Lachnospiraceae bacterium]|nr:alanyl-tRNA editing protein [Lachnospiraceae bacterium]